MTRKLKIAALTTALALAGLHSTAQASLLPLVGGLLQTTTQTVTTTTSTLLEPVNQTLLQPITSTVVAPTASALVQTTSNLTTAVGAGDLTTTTVALLDAQLQSSLVQGLVTTVDTVAVLSTGTSLSGLTGGGLNLSSSTDLCLSAGISLGGSGGTGGLTCAMDGGSGGGAGGGSGGGAGGGMVPEPASGLLVALAAGSLWWSRRRETQPRTA